MIAPETVTLFLGPTVPVDALRLVWHLEARGVTLRIGDDGALFAGPQSRLTPDDLMLLRRYRRDVGEIIRYVDEAPYVELAN